MVWLLARSTDLAGRLLGVKGRGGQEGITEEEIKLLVTEQGTLLEEEKRMIHEIFELGDTVAREVMVPRVDVEFIEDSATRRPSPSSRSSPRCNGCATTWRSSSTTDCRSRMR